MINKLYVMVLAMVLAMPAWAQKEKNHDFVVAKNMDVLRLSIRIWI